MDTGLARQTAAGSMEGPALAGQARWRPGVPVLTGASSPGALRNREWGLRWERPL